MRERHAEFARKGVRVFGLSLDDADSHRKFRDKLQLPFPLLVDAGGTVAAAYGVKKAMGPVNYAGRSFFLIARDGKILYADPAFGLDDAGWAALFKAVAALPDAGSPAAAPRAASAPA